MNSGQYHQQRLHTTPGLPISFHQYSDAPVSSSGQSTSSHPMLSCDSLPRLQQQQQLQSPQHFMTNPPVSSSNLLGTNYDLGNSMPPVSMTTNPTCLWQDQSQHTPSFEDPNTNDYYDYSPGLTTGANDNNNGVWLDPGIPRWMPDNPRLYNDPSSNMTMLDSYEQMYPMNNAHKHDLQTMNQSRPNLIYPSLEEPRDHFARLSISHSPLSGGPKQEDECFGPSSLPFDKPPAFMTSNESSPDENGGNSSREMTAVDVDDHGADEPYAKLIYRALMSAPNHSMVLQEIYQWFRDNTAKGASDGKGWMNSIRHNLSMNAAFKKTERKLQGDDTKKSTEWVLEPFAIKDGVQSTTRYRKGTSSAKKLPRAGAAAAAGGEYPAPTRQSSGRKGGMCKTKLSRHHHHQQQQRPKEDRDHFSTSRIDSVRRAQFERQTSSGRRQRSPLTPPPAGDAGPYFAPFPKVEQEQEHMDSPFEEMYGLEECQGVYTLDGGPLFSGDGSGPFHQHQHHQHHAAAAAAGGSGGGSAMSTSRF